MPFAIFKFFFFIPLYRILFDETNDGLESFSGSSTIMLLFYQIFFIVTFKVADDGL